MGDPIVDWEQGGACTRCENILYYKDQTPKYVEVLFEGLENCNWLPDEVPPPNGHWILEQVAVAPCQWQYITATLRIFYWIQLGSTLLAALIWERAHTTPFAYGWRYYFLDTINAECQVSFVNEADCTFTQWWAKGGTGQVHIPTGMNIAYLLAIDYNLVPHLDTMSEHWWYDYSLANTCVVNLARYGPDSNILIKWDRSHYDQDIMTET